MEIFVHVRLFRIASPSSAPFATLTIPIAARSMEGGTSVTQGMIKKVRTGSYPTFFYNVSRVVLGHLFSTFHLRRPEIAVTESLDHCLD